MRLFLGESDYSLEDAYPGILVNMYLEKYHLKYRDMLLKIFIQK